MPVPMTNNVVPMSGGGFVLQEKLDIGVGLGGLSYFSAALPFINVLKQGMGNGHNGAHFNWTTQNSSGADTSEEAWLVVDANGYPTTLTAGNGFSGTQQFVKVQLGSLVNVAMAPGQTYAFPHGSYTFSFQGQGTFVVGVGYGTPSVSSSSPGISISSNVVTSAQTSGSTATVTFDTLTTGTNLTITITATDPNSTGDYLRNFSLYQTAYQTNVTNGEIFNPTWLSLLDNFTTLRFMDWLKTNNSQQSATLTAVPASLAVSATLSTAWTYPSGTYYFAFDTGDEKLVMCTYNSTAISWSGGLSKAGSATTVWYSIKASSWASRASPNDIEYDTNFGVPWEIIVTLCNTANKNPWINIPPEMMNADIQSLLQYFHDNLNSNLTVYMEYGNEVWNGGFKANAFTNFRGIALWGTANNPQQSYMGMKLATIADTCDSIFGKGSPRFKVIAGGQAANPYVVEQVLTAPAWVANGGTTPWSAHSIGGICIDQYWGSIGSFPAGWLALGQSGFLDNAFQEVQYGGVMAGYDFTSGYTNSGLAAPLNRLQLHVTAMQSYGNLPVYAYEGDQNGAPQGSELWYHNNVPSAWVASHSYSSGNKITGTDGHPYVCKTGGTSGATAPGTWASTVGGTVTDNTVTWMRINWAATNWAASTSYLVGDSVIDSNSNLQICTTAGTSGATAPTWSTVYTSTTTDNQVVWTYYSAKTFGYNDTNQDSMFWPYYDAFSRDARIYPLIRQWVNNFYYNGGKMLLYFVECSSSSKAGQWGALESLMQVINPTGTVYKWQAINDAVAGS